MDPSTTADDQSGSSIEPGEPRLDKEDLHELTIKELQTVTVMQGVKIAKLELEKFLLTLSKEQRLAYAAAQRVLTQAREVEKKHVDELRALRGRLSKKYDLDFNDPGVFYDDETGRLFQDGAPQGVDSG